MTHLFVVIATACSLALSTGPTTISTYGTPNVNAEDAVAGTLMLIPGIKVEIKWSGSGFLCLNAGNSCDITIGGSLSVQASPETYGFPAGSHVGFIDMVDGMPVDGAGPLSLGERTVDEENIAVVDGDPLPPGTTIYIPEQETVFDPDGGHMFYYFGG